MLNLAPLIGVHLTSLLVAEVITSSCSWPWRPPRSACSLPATSSGYTLPTALELGITCPFAAVLLTLAVTGFGKPEYGVGTLHQGHPRHEGR